MEKQSRFMVLFATALLAMVVCHSTAWGQYEMLSMMALSGGGDEGLVTAGQAELQKQPVVIRLHVDINAKGENLEKALDSLDKQIETAKKKIEKLKPVENSIKVGNPQISLANDERQRQMEMMIQEGMMGSDRKPPQGLKMVKMAAVRVSFQVDWSLDAQTPSEQLLLIDELKTEIEKADISGKKEEKLSPEEEEMMEEMQGMGSRYGSDDEIEPGTPVFVFIAKISKEEKLKLLQDAYQDAHQQAEDLTTALKVPLGKLTSLGGGIQKGNQGFSGGMEDYRMQQYMQQLGVENMVEEDEAVSQECGPLTFHAYVKATYAME